MKTNYTYNLMRDYGIDWGRNFREEESGQPNQYHPLQNIENTHYSEIGGLKQENQKLKQQIKDQQELIYHLETALYSNIWGDEIHSRKMLPQLLTNYKNKYQ